jgi:hypothetical protein
MHSKEVRKMNRLAAFLGAIVISVASTAFASDVGNIELSSVQDPHDTPNLPDKAKRNQMAKPDAEDAGVEDVGPVLQYDDDPPPNQGSPDDGPRQPKSGCSAGGHSDASQLIYVVMCVAIAAACRRNGRPSQQR